MLSIVPRFCETILNYLQKRKLAAKLAKGDVLFFAIVLGLLHYFYQHEV